METDQLQHMSTKISVLTINVCCLTMKLECVLTMKIVDNFVHFEGSENQTRSGVLIDCSCHSSPI